MRNYTTSVVWWLEFLAANTEVLCSIPRRYQIFCLTVGVERDPLNLVRINEELFERQVAAPV
jgi:hypothetical protein